MMNKTKIEWCDITWNPVWGCKNNCSYCYARKIAKRFAGIKGLNETSRKIHEKLYYADLEGAYLGNLAFDSLLQKISENLYNFKPTWLESNFQKKFPKKPNKRYKRLCGL